MADDESSVFQYGSVFIPVYDAYPSTAISSAWWEPLSGTVLFNFTDGGSETYDCDVSQWLAYKASASRGQHYNHFFRKRK